MLRLVPLWLYLASTSWKKNKKFFSWIIFLCLLQSELSRLLCRTVGNSTKFLIHCLLFLLFFRDKLNHCTCLIDNISIHFRGHTYVCVFLPPVSPHYLRGVGIVLLHRHSFGNSLLHQNHWNEGILSSMFYLILRITFYLINWILTQEVNMRNPNDLLPIFWSWDWIIFHAWSSSVLLKSILRQGWL